MRSSSPTTHTSPFSALRRRLYLSPAATALILVRKLPCSSFICTG